MTSESQDLDSEWDFAQALDLLMAGSDKQEISHPSGTPVSVPSHERPFGYRFASSAASASTGPRGPRHWPHDSDHEPHSSHHRSHDSDHDKDSPGNINNESLFKLLYSDLSEWAVRGSSAVSTGSSKIPRSQQPSNDSLFVQTSPSDSLSTRLQSRPITIPSNSHAINLPAFGIPAGRVATNRNGPSEPALQETMLKHRSLPSPYAGGSSAEQRPPVSPLEPHTSRTPMTILRREPINMNPSDSNRPATTSNSRYIEHAHRNDISDSTVSTSSDAIPTIFDRPIPRNSGLLTLVPSQVGIASTQNGIQSTSPSSYEDTFGASTHPRRARNGASNNRTLLISPNDMTVLERSKSIMTKLLDNLDDYAQLLLQMGNSQSSIETVESRPVHVFVDMSNILVGFHNAVKFVRNIPSGSRMRRLDISFSNLALILQRGRRVAKKVLLGSDQVPSVDEARKLGYEVNILSRVQKTKNSSSKSGKAPIKGAHSGRPGMAGTTERWVEQGVDEILHLKMLESLVDEKSPSTVVLATGDAAEAEYSEGFMRMVERALQLGWNVELVSFSQVTSYAYKKLEFREKWGSQFRIIDLDLFVEELFV
ncbi:hypothetical protein N7466_004490 [Penicillium verhagenii]|uniref:uncharacterized protein n=1 Tax=Penicillium verhagenii TaxID=1562060 RepID=UPI002545AA9F|nr:uncharacterized protein N7466_004490 [Penicillium verhagenii]KAJ5934943.1 hypothetical protein N7466_004490 [Penicillium verhagenii]